MGKNKNKTQAPDQPLDQVAEERKVEDSREDTPKGLEEQKVEPVTEAPLKRANSKFNLAEENADKKLYRPQFGADEKDANEKIWELMSSYIGTDQKAIQRSIINHVEYTLARTRFNFDNLGAY